MSSLDKLLKTNFSSTQLTLFDQKTISIPEKIAEIRK
ncbi:hypothetical protein T01_573 [Trichinella spiralis]|uniref:Uncharacterized protein n=1 Tax=Trichinella spiralis TaxID=6334 RepID=A0A0V0Z0M2_TRISP|nr:hypothetical protein T01_573 [Trichinella spiralis]